MSDKPPVTFHDPSFDLSPIPYVEGYDDPEANVVFVCSDKKAIRVHDYYLKAESPLFREMFQAGTRGGPIGIDEASKDFAFILDLVTRKQAATLRLEAGKSKLSELLRVEPITRKYMFETANALLRLKIAHCAGQCPPEALEFAMSCQPPDRLIAMLALQNFADLMNGIEMSSFFTTTQSQNRYQYSPHAHNLRRDFVENKLGLKGYYAYSVALAKGQSNRTQWDWKKVAQVFVEELKLAEVKAMTP